MHTDDRPSDEQKQIQNCILNSQQIVFIGLSYATEKLFTGTGIGISGRKERKIVNLLNTYTTAPGFSLQREKNCLQILKAFIC